MRLDLLALGLLAGLGDVLGGLLAVAVPANRKGAMGHLGALAGGCMLGTCLLLLLPEVLERDPQAPLLTAIGFLLVFIAENVFGHLAHEPSVEHEHDAAHELVGILVTDEPLITRLASWIAFAGLGVHAFFDGVTVALSWTVGPAAGVAAFLAVTLHKIPEGLSVSAIMLAAARGRGSALTSAGALAALTVAGVLAGLAVNGALAIPLLALATGTLLYVAAADLLPMVSRTGPATAPLTVAVGLALIQVTLVLVRAVGLEG